MKEQKNNVDLKIHTGFRLTSDNYKLLEKLEGDLGLNKTGVVNMILTLIDNDRNVLVNLISKAIVAK